MGSFNVRSVRFNLNWLMIDRCNLLSLRRLEWKSELRIASWSETLILFDQKVL